MSVAYLPWEGIGHIAWVTPLKGGNPFGFELPNLLAFGQLRLIWWGGMGILRIPIPFGGLLCFSASFVWLWPDKTNT